MKTSIREYMLLNQSFFFKYSYLYIAILFMMIPLLSKWLGMDIEVIVFSSISYFMIQDLCNKKFPLLTSMPIRSHTITTMLYVNALIFCFLGVTLSHIFYAMIHVNRPLFVSFIVFLLSLLGGNLYYVLFTSSEFSEDPSEQIVKMFPYIFGVILIVIILLGAHRIIPYGILFYLSSRLTLTIKIIISLILSLLTLSTLFFSYKYVCHKVYR